jgi:hypothetical protein
MLKNVRKVGGLLVPGPSSQYFRSGSLILKTNGDVRRAEAIARKRQGTSGFFI